MIGALRVNLFTTATSLLCLLKIGLAVLKRLYCSCLHILIRDFSVWTHTIRIFVRRGINQTMDLGPFWLPALKEAFSWTHIFLLSFQVSSRGMYRKLHHLPGLQINRIHCNLFIRWFIIRQFIIRVYYKFIIRQFVIIRRFKGGPQNNVLYIDTKMYRLY